MYLWVPAKPVFSWNKFAEDNATPSFKNNRDQAISIEILDQVPISKNNKIKVDYKLGEGLKINEETGMLEWILEVPANTKQSTFFEFEVKHPKKLNISL